MKESLPLGSTEDATKTERVVETCWGLSFKTKLATTSMSSVNPLADSGASPVKTLSSQASQGGNEGEEKEALMDAAEI